MREFSETKVVATFDVTVVKMLTENDVDDIVVGALEGGINYWGFVTPKTYLEKPRNIPTSTWCTKLLLEGKDIYVADIEGDHDIWQLNLPKLEKGIRMNANRHLRTDIEDYDAEDYDRIFQYALFDEVMFG